MQLMTLFWSDKSNTMGKGMYRKLRFRCQLALTAATAIRGIGMRKVSRSCPQLRGTTAASPVLSAS